ncbi:MAG: hypothetical protein E4G98_03355 [Promethearchaeota archaeon]|nr:MAG: hypothetical protein E4G98_03355 [Candidatus Lokiarchaeota archaeon]
MEVIAMYQMRELLQQNLPKYQQPILLISTSFYPGCSKCNSDATVFQARIMEKSELSMKDTITKIQHHKFPFEVFTDISTGESPPTKIWLGTRINGPNHELIVRKIEI